MASMRRALTRSFDVAYSGFVLAVSFLALAVLAFQYTSETITNESFFIIYTVLLTVGVVFAGFSVFYHVFDTSRRGETERGLASTFYLADSSPLRPLSSLEGRAFLSIGLVVFVFLSVGVLGSVIGTPNPYNSGGLTKSVLDGHGLFANIVNVAVYPGISEELVTFGIVNVVTFLILFVFGFFGKALRPLLYWPATFVGVTVGALLFTLAHRSAYGLDGESFVSAFVFSWVVQFANQLGGFFISWLPHVLHNALVVLGTTTALSIGGLSAAFIVWRSRKWS